MSPEQAVRGQTPLPAPVYLPEIPVFSPRLAEVLGEVVKGDAPNRGRFCGHCFTPLAADRRSCPHCDTPVSRRPPVDEVPAEVVAMYRRQRRRESLVVNSFAYLGLTMGVVLFLLLFIIYDALWWRILDMVILVVAARVFAALLGGLLGDEVGYRFARRRLAREWGEWVGERDEKRGVV